jgi:hypothetical protein
MTLRIGLLLTVFASSAMAQEDVEFRIGARVPVELPPLFQRGAKFLVESQRDDGSWKAQSSFGSNGTGVTSLCVLALMSTGEDPNFGPYARSVRRGLEYLIRKQNAKSGLPGGNAYDFGFTMLAMAEAYGAVDEDLMFAGDKAGGKRTLGEALELAVKGACTMKHKTALVGHGWNSTASSGGIPDTSVAGSVLVGLLAARNAGIEVSDDVMKRAMDYFRKMTNKSGTVGYFQTRGNDYGNSIARSSITALVLAIGKQKTCKEYTSTAKYISSNLEMRYATHPLYGDYYQAQALFQVNYKAWQNWNRERVRQIVLLANDDGSIARSQVGPAYSTAMSMLTLALNYRFLPIYER